MAEAEPDQTLEHLEWLRELKDPDISAVTLNTSNYWELKHFDRLVNGDDERLVHRENSYSTRTTHHQVSMKLLYGEVQGRSSGRSTIMISVKPGSRRLQAQLLLTMSIVDQENYRHVILRDRSISLWGRATCEYEVITPTSEILNKLAWDDNTLHISSELEEFISSAINVEPRSPSHSTYKDRLVIRLQFDPYRTPADVFFYLGDQQIAAHRRLVEPRSPYLREAIRRGSSQPNNARYVDLSRQAHSIGLTPVLLEAVFDYIYGRRSILELHEHAFELLPVASALGMDTMKRSLEYYICDGINENNIVDVLLLLRKCECKFLRPQAVAYAQKQLGVIANSERFKALCKDPVLMRELCSGDRR